MNDLLFALFLSTAIGAAALGWFSQQVLVAKARKNPPR